MGFYQEKKKITAIYIRVSTEKQELNNQLEDLRRYCKKQGWKIYKVYSDVVSGKEVSEEKRPGFTGLFRDAHKKVFDVVLFWDLSRFSRSGTLYTLQKLQELKNNGIDWVSYQNIPVEVPLGPEDGLPKRCVANLDTITTVNKRFLTDRISLLSSKKMEEIHKAIKFALDI